MKYYKGHLNEKESVLKFDLFYKQLDKSESRLFM